MSKTRIFVSSTCHDLAPVRESLRAHILGGQFADWEEDPKAKAPPEIFSRLKDTMGGWTEFVLREMEKLPQELMRPFANGARPTGAIAINLPLAAKPMDDSNNTRLSIMWCFRSAFYTTDTAPPDESASLEV